MITFSTVGYGDIVPTSDEARFVVMLEIFLSFFLIVFALTNIKKIHRFGKPEPEEKPTRVLQAEVIKAEDVQRQPGP